MSNAYEQWFSELGKALANKHPIPRSPRGLTLSHIEHMERQEFPNGIFEWMRGQNIVTLAVLLNNRGIAVFDSIRREAASRVNALEILKGNMSLFKKTWVMVYSSQEDPGGFYSFKPDDPSEIDVWKEEWQRMNELFGMPSHVNEKHPQIDGLTMNQVKIALRGV